MHLPDLLHLLARKSFVLAVLDGRGLLVVFTLLPLADDTFLLDHSLETLDRLLEWFVLIYFYVCHIKSPPLPSGSESSENYHFAQDMSISHRFHFDNGKLLFFLSSPVIDVRGEYNRDMHSLLIALSVVRIPPYSRP